uniref:Uncharacterized protein n=1 Tax=Acrobeloides nanus TaxID=290746 RepID=A0A914EI45_9BILA
MLFEGSDCYNLFVAIDKNFLDFKNIEVAAGHVYQLDKIVSSYKRCYLPNKFVPNVTNIENAIDMNFDLYLFDFKNYIVDGSVNLTSPGYKYLIDGVFASRIWRPLCHDLPKDFWGIPSSMILIWDNKFSYDKESEESFPFSLFEKGNSSMIQFDTKMDNKVRSFEVTIY